MLRPIREVARGRWRGILPALGIEPGALSGKQGPCPLCGGKTRFRFDDKNGSGSWICNHCGAGDGVSLVMAKHGLEFKDAARRIEDLAGEARREAPKQERSERQQREAMNALWRASKPVHAGDVVHRYLTARVGDFEPLRSLRCAERCLYQGETSSWHPAMIAMVSGPDGRPATLHRTYLTSGGGKADVAEVRKTMPGAIPDGASVRLAEPGPIMGVAEGIETAFAAAKLFDIPVWSALNAAILRKWLPPQEAREVIVFGDNDANFTGQEAAYALARRLANSGLKASVRVPEQEGKDWNDVLIALGAAA